MEPDDHVAAGAGGPEAAAADPPPLIEVDRLVEELRRRAAALRSAGAGGEGTDFGALELEGPDRPHVAFRPELGYSSKPVVGKAITGVKRGTLRMLFHVFDALARETDQAVGALWRRADDLEARLEREIGAREHVQRDVAGLASRMAAIEEAGRALQADQRLGRLERGLRDARPTAAQPLAAPAAPAGDTAPPAAVPAPAPAPALRMDYERFEDRFRPEEAVRRHQARYVDLLEGAGRVVDVGCGRGELVQMLRDRGVDAYGLEVEPDFVALAQERDLPVTLGDGVAHVASLPQDSLGGVVSSHVVEHLEPAEVLRLIEGAANALAPGGILILETPNPESLIAGSVNFHRDLTHRRPIHPDALAFLCETAGFASVEVLRLSPVDPAGLLPPPAEDTADREYLDAVVRRLNDLLFGFQDYAVVARLP